MNNARERLKMWSAFSGIVVLSIETYGCEELLGDIHAAHLIGMDAIPSDIARMHMLEESIPTFLQINADQIVLGGQFLDDRAEFVHASAHGIGLVRLHEIGGHEDHALHARQRLLDKALIAGTIVFEGDMLLLEFGAVELTPYIVDADEDADVIGILFDYVGLPALFQIARLVTADAHVHDAQMQFGIHAAKERTNVRNVAAAPRVEQAFADRTRALIVGNGIADKENFAAFFKDHVNRFAFIKFAH